ncbi:MAG: hypothetical protein JWM45_691, partial [Pseudonocardiales bacterium]|nr:hypothetical protein [Pseudonocardiales bacterium]
MRYARGATRTHRKTSTVDHWGCACEHVDSEPH